MVRRPVVALLLPLVAACDPIVLDYDAEGEKLPAVDTGLRPGRAPQPRIADCLAAEGTEGEVVEEVLEIGFSAADEPCRWSEDGNLAPAEGRITARREDEARIGLPRDALLCDLSITASGWGPDDIDPAHGERVFDDHFLLTVAGVPVAASAGALIAPLRETEVGLPLYDWAALAGLATDPTASDPWCLGSGACAVPGADTPGPLVVALDPGDRRELVRRAEDRHALPVGLVVFGDDDKSDCTRAPLAVTLRIGLQPR